MSVTPQHVLERVAQRFALSLDKLRGDRHAAHEAQIAYCYLAHGLTGCSGMTIGMRIGRDQQWVAAAIDECATRALAEDRRFHEVLTEIEIECLAEAGVADRTHYPLPRMTEPHAIAQRLVASPREALQVGIADLQTIGAAFLAIEETVALTARGPVAKTPDEELLISAALAYQAAARAAAQARFTTAERAATAARYNARQNLMKLIGVDHGQTN